MLKSLNLGADKKAMKTKPTTMCKKCSAPSLNGNYGFCGEHRGNTTSSYLSVKSKKSTIVPRGLSQRLPQRRNSRAVHNEASSQLDQFLLEEFGESESESSEEDEKEGKTVRVHPQQRTVRSTATNCKADSNSKKTGKTTLIR